MYQGATIAVQRDDGSIRRVFCHSDGHPSYMKKALAAYTTREQVDLLISLGDIRRVDTKFSPSPRRPHTFLHPQKGVLLSYARDRGDVMVQPSEFASFEEGMSRVGQKEYNYLFTPDWGWGVLYREYQPCNDALLHGLRSDMFYRFHVVG